MRLHWRACLSALALTLGACGAGAGAPVAETWSAGAGACAGTRLEGSWIVTAFHCHIAFAARATWRAALGDVAIYEEPGAHGRFPIRRVWCEARLPRELVWRERVYRVQLRGPLYGVLVGAPVQLGDSGSPVLTRSGRLAGIVVALGGVFQRMHALCGRLRQLRASGQ